MSEISALSAALQNVQQQAQNELSMKAVKQAARAEQAPAAMLAQQARALAETARKQQATGGGISISV